MRIPFELEVVEIYSGIPIVEARCKEPTIMTPETDVELAHILLEQTYPQFAVVLNCKNLSHGTGYTPEDEARVHQSEPFAELKKRAVAFIRFHSVSFTSMIQSMRANTLVRQSMSVNLAPDLDSAVRLARRAIDRSKVLST